MSEKKFLFSSPSIESKRYSILVGISFLILAIVSVVTLVTPPGYAIWVLYIPVITLSMHSKRPNVPVYLAAFCVAWIILDFFVMVHQEAHSVILVRRAIGSVAIFSVSAIVRAAIIAKLNEEKGKIALEESARNLAKEKLKLERSNRELEQFAGVAAHDLRSPITMMSSWIDMLERYIAPPRTAEVDQAISIIKGNAKKADNLINDVLQISRVNISKSNIVRVDLMSIMGEIKTDLKELIQNSAAKIHMTSLPTVWGNKTYLTSLFTNLVRNALIYRDKARHCEISIGCRDNGNFFEFFVKDNGVGIESKYTSRVFEMFKRLNSEKEYPGSGIGLAFCKKIVEHSGGTIWVESQPGKGSTFYFTYPMEIRSELET